MVSGATRLAVWLLAGALFGSALFASASAAHAQPGGMDGFPAHPGGRVELRAVTSGPLTAAEIVPLLTSLPERLRRCAIARASDRRHVASGIDFVLEVRPNGRARAVDLVTDPRDRSSPQERAWLVCARRVVGLLRFPAKGVLSMLRLRLVWMRDDVPHGEGLL